MASTEAKARKRRQVLWSYVFITPQLLLYLGLFVVPLIIALPLIFSDQLNFTDNGEFIGLGNFRELFGDEQVRSIYVNALLRTLAFTVVNYVVVMSLGFLLALAIYEIGFRGTFFTVIFLPYMFSGFAIGVLALMLFSEGTGVINLLLQELGIIDTPIGFKTPAGSLVVLPTLVAWRMAGFFMAIFLTGLLAIPVETIEAAEVDGASYFQRVRLVYLPQMKAAFLIATTFAIISAFNVFDELIALGALFQNRAIEFLSIVVFKFGFLSNRLALGMTIAVVTFVPLAFGGWLLQRQQRRISNE